MNKESPDRERTLTDAQIHQGFIKCENEIEKQRFEVKGDINRITQELEFLKQPLDNIIQDLLKEKEMMERQMDRYDRLYREMQVEKDNDTERYKSECKNINLAIFSAFEFYKLILLCYS